jgi:hypothetical protein
MSNRGPTNRDIAALLNFEEFDSLAEVGKGDAQCEIPQLQWERLVALGTDRSRRPPSRGRPVTPSDSSGAIRAASGIAVALFGAFIRLAAVPAAR